MSGKSLESVYDSFVAGHQDTVLSSWLLPPDPVHCHDDVIRSAIKAGKMVDFRILGQATGSNCQGRRRVQPFVKLDEVICIDQEDDPMVLDPLQEEEDLAVPPEDEASDEGIPLCFGHFTGGGPFSIPIRRQYMESWLASTLLGPVCHDAWSLQTCRFLAASSRLSLLAYFVSQAFVYSFESRPLGWRCQDPRTWGAIDCLHHHAGILYVHILLSLT